MIKQVLFVVSVVMALNSFAQCDTTNIKEDFVNGKLKCYDVKSSIQQIVLNETEWVVTGKLKKKEFDLDSITFFNDSTAVFYTKFQTKRSYINPLIFGTVENDYFCLFESKLGGDLINHIYVRYFDDKYLIISIKTRFKKRWKKQGRFLLERIR